MDDKHLEMIKRMIDQPAIDTVIIETYPPVEIPSEDKDKVSAEPEPLGPLFPDEKPEDKESKKVVSYVCYRRKRRNLHRKSIINRSKKQRIQSKRQRYKARRKEAVIRSIKISAISLRRHLAQYGVTRKDVADYLNIRERTLKNWEDNWDRNRLRIKRRGRPIKLSSIQLRNTIFVMLKTMGPKLSMTTVQDMYPDVPIVEIEDMVIRYRNLCERNNELVLTHTKWTTPGIAWAMDFATPPGKHLIDGIYPRVCAVRDLSCGFQLAWDAVMAEDTRSALKVIRRLFVVFGKPLILKIDNGAGFISDTFMEEMERENVYILFSPPLTPQYNGAVEAGNGWMKHWTDESSCYHGCPGRWSLDDLYAAMMRGNRTIRMDKKKGLHRREELWESRPKISAEVRADFSRRVESERKKEREKQSVLPDMELSRAGQAKIDRIVLPRVLSDMGFLEYEKERISELIYRE